MSGRRLVLYSGIPPGSSGTGQLVGWLKRQGADVVYSGQHSQSPRALLFAGRVGIALREVVVANFLKARFRLRFWLDSFLNRHEVVLLHPQTIGLRRTLDFIRRRRRAPLMFLLDSSFFCIRSYNHLPGTVTPCLECLGGRFEAIDEHSCEPFPVPDVYASTFVRELRELVRSGRLHIVAQCATQAQLATRHFGVQVPLVGLWTNDWVSVFDAPAPAPMPVNEPRADVIFHGFCVEAKGARWVGDVAQKATRLRFLMPFPRCAPLENAPLNCEFTPMTWERGLSAAVKAASVVLVPSLWSAPVESALVKSISMASAVAVVENDTAFASEIPRDVVLHLSPDPARAAVELMNAVEGGWRPNAAAKSDWLASWRARNEPVLDTLHDVVGQLATGDARRPTAVVSPPVPDPPPRKQ